mmetsp:Transcript_9460/g.13841  ORF Transcript_9460/g.13841 Transcript_9460/m.13841 type:complete len:227 (-) Transcript_9460:58-738(-)|eukprot:CAMPEP_0175100976 /NCGR_PEP_ID=MMETSP0086_2-20121207/7485_1 /TAXON_ID=136419 /ORGANISM="Unknown Unknown, Strain D1" /LENGTH=226 /DNA_ID=CAMNT_0016375345 /DNA_START=26 /DNA_END=706 /DNA_ORIENTATION=+
MDGGAQPEPQQGNSNSIANTPPATLKWLIRLSNSICAGLVIASGVLSISTNPIVCSYVIVLGAVACCFEFHLRSFDQFVFENFGFMFHWFGRMVFFIFVGSLSFGLDSVLGYIAGAYNVFNILFNIYAVRVNAEYRAYVEAANKQYMANAKHAAAQELQVKANFSGSFQDARNAANFYKENKETVHAAANFYAENKEAVDAGAKFAAQHKDQIGSAAQAGHNSGFI